MKYALILFMALSVSAFADPQITAPAVDITSLEAGTNNWDTAFGWGDHSTNGYGTGSGDIGRVNITAGDWMDGTVDTTTGDHTQTLDVDTNAVMAAVTSLNYVVSGSITDDDVSTQVLGSPAHTTARDLHNVTSSGGIISGAVVTDAGSGTVDITAAELLIRSSNADTGELFAATSAAVTGQVLTDNSVNYIYVEYNAGTPQITVSTSPLADVYQNIIVGIVYRTGTEIHITNINTPPQQVSQKLGKRLAFVDGLTRQSGSIISEVGTNMLAVTSGAWWLGLSEYTIGAWDTSASDTFTSYYDDNAGGFTAVTNQTTIDNLQYDDGSGTLATLGNGKYGVHWVYLGLEGDHYVVYGLDSYTLTGAEEAVPPTSLPLQITGFHSALIGKIVIRESAAVFTTIQNPFDVVFGFGTAVDHGDLAGLSDNDHPQYAVLADYNVFNESNKFKNIEIDSSSTIFGGGFGTPTEIALDVALVPKFRVSSDAGFSFQQHDNDLWIAADGNGGVLNEDIAIWQSEGTATTGVQIVNYQTMTNQGFAALASTNTFTGDNTFSGTVIAGVITNSGGAWVDLSNAKLGDGAVTSLNYGSSLLMNGAFTSVDWANRQLKDSGGTTVLDWDTYALAGTWTVAGTAATGTQIVNYETATNLIATLGGDVSWASAPASNTATGTQGDTAYDDNYFYVAISNNVWRRTTLATW